MSIDIANESGVAVDEVALAAIARSVLDELHIHPLAELSVLLVDEKAMSELHERWMGEPGPTDVLAFPMDELRPPHLGGVNAGRAGAEEPGPDPGLLGDVVLCPQVAAAQAREAGHSTQAELELLAVHGLLHLLGYRPCRAGREGRDVRPAGPAAQAGREAGRFGVMSAQGWLVAAAIVLVLMAGWWASAEVTLARLSAVGRGAARRHRPPGVEAAAGRLR